MAEHIHPDTRKTFHKDMVNVILAIIGGAFYSYGAGLAVLLAPLILSGFVGIYRPWPSAVLNTVAGYLFSYGIFTVITGRPFGGLLIALAMFVWISSFKLGVIYRPERTKLQRDIINMSAVSAAGILLAISPEFSGFAVLGLPAILSATVAPYRRAGAAYANFVVSMSLFAGFYIVFNDSIPTFYALGAAIAGMVAIMSNPILIHWWNEYRGDENRII